MIKDNRKFAEMNAGKEFNYAGERVRVIGHTKRKRLVYLIVTCRKTAGTLLGLMGCRITPYWYARKQRSSNMYYLKI